MNIRRILIALFGLIFVTQASAVALNSGKEGQVLIFPYFSNLGGNQTLIQISRSLQGPESLRPRALKFHFRDRFGVRKFSFNLYLARSESIWTAAIATVNGQSQLILPEDSCTVPQLKQPGSNAVEVPLTSGFFEVIDMGNIADQATQDAAKNFDCTRLQAMWGEGGVWRNNDSGFQLDPPAGFIRGTTQLINVQEGTLYSIVATALTEFSDIPQHTGPESETPNLSTPHDEGTASGATKSIKCFESLGTCQEDAWLEPGNAVAAVLSSNELRAEYTINDAIGAKAELILTFPMENFESSVPRNPPGVLLNIAGINIGNVACRPLLDRSPCSGDYITNTGESVFLASLNDSSEDFGGLVTSDILKDSHIAFFPEPGDPALPIMSTLEVYFPLHNNHMLTSNSGTKYAGHPVIGYILQKYSNGQLTNEQGDKIKANYGNAFELSQKGR